MAEDLIYSTRRDFLKDTLGTVSMASTMPWFLCRTAEALSREDSSDGRILVIVQLAGGNDGLNTVVPFGNDDYYRARPSLGIAADQCLKISDNIGLHSAAVGLGELFDDGKLAIVQGVGYPNPNRSHFRSMDIWHTADPSGRRHSGWLGRYFDACCSSTGSVDPQRGIALMPEAPLALAGDKFSPLAFESAEDLTWRSTKSSADANKIFAELNDNPPEPGKKKAPGHNDALDFLRRAALDARMGAADVQAAAKRVGGKRRGRQQALQQQLALVSQMIAAEFPTSVYYVSFGGFDTHSSQDGRHRQLISQLGDALKWFMGKLQEDGLLDRVLVLTFSEFGRRVNENASGGTDHGTAAPMFLMGSKVVPGLHQKQPSLSQLDQGDLVFNTDFRRVYAAVLRDWLKVKPAQVLRGKFPPLKLIQR